MLQFIEMRFGGEYNHCIGREYIKKKPRRKYKEREREKEREKVREIVVESIIMYHILGSCYWCILKRKTNSMQS